LRLETIPGARAREGKARDSVPDFFTVVFYGLKIFGCKTAQLRATRCESRMDKLPSVSNDVQRSENARKNSFLN
jgi:hypothetical protein